MKKVLTTGFVIVGALIVTALGIDATDTLRNNSGTLLSQLIVTTDGGCPRGMTEVVGHSEPLCVDVYEASTFEKCPIESPQNALESKENVDTAECGSVSEEGREPWRHLTREQAHMACVRSGKRLPTNEEWYRAALGTPDTEACNTESGVLSESGEHHTCISASGAYDMVGNAWEWVSGDVREQTFDGVLLPESGYIAQVDSRGIPVVASSTEVELFNGDYNWEGEGEATFAIIRGGFYNSDTDGGVYAFHAGTLPTTPGVAVGFRCVLDL